MILFGFSLVHTTLNSQGNFQINSRFTFNGNITGNALADYMIGKPYSFLQGGVQVGYDRLNAPAFYVQDNWKVSSRFGVNVGLRWDPFLPQHMIKNMLTHFEPGWFNQGLRSTVFTNAPAGLIFQGNAGFPGQSDTSQKLAQFSPRVGIVYDPRGAGRETIRAGYGIFYNTAAFVRNTTGTFGNVGRNTILGPGYWNLDLALMRTFSLTERQKLELRAESFNAMNHANFSLAAAMGSPSSLSLTSSAFWKIQTAADPRIMQFAIKYVF